MDLFKTLKYNSSEPFVARTGTRAVIFRLNMMMIALCTAHLRNEKFGMPVAANGSTVDSREEQVEGAQAGAEQEQHVREEQGYEVAGEPPLKVAARLKLIRDALAEDLDKNAGERQMPDPKNPSRTILIKDQFHVAQTLEMTMDFLVTANGPLVSEATVKATAAAMGITPDEVRQAAQAGSQRRSQFLHQNREDVLKLAASLIPADKDGYALSTEQAEETLEALEPLQRLQLAAAFDRALHKHGQREIAEYIRTGLPQHQSNFGVLNGIRRQIRAELLTAWAKEQGWEQGLNAALDRGARYPDFGPMPAPAEQSKTGTHA